MLTAAIRKTKACRFKFRCLDTNRQHPVCDVVVANGNNVLFVNNDTDANCKYSGLSGNRPICSCPTHYALHHKQGLHMKRTPVLSREAYQQHKPPAGAGKVMPQTVDAAVKILMKDLPAEEKATIMKLRADDVGEVASGLIDQIRSTFDLEADDRTLLLACSREAGYAIEHPEDAAAVILARLVMTLVKERKQGPV